MKISVLIAAYQAGPFIRTALDSVRAQSHADREVIVVEDGSHDDTEAIVRGFVDAPGASATYVNLGENRGVAAARNRLLELATGELIAFLDADDMWAGDHLAVAVARLAAGAELAVSDVHTFDRLTWRHLGDCSPPPALSRDPVLTLFQGSVIVTSSSVVLSRALAERAGRFDPSFRIGEDRDYWLRCALAGGRFAATSRCTCNYAKHSASAMTRTPLVAEQAVRFYEKHRSLARVPRRLRRRLLAHSLVNQGRLLRASDPRASAGCFGRAWRCSPFDPRIAAHLARTGWRLLRPRGDAAFPDGPGLSHPRP